MRFLPVAVLGLASVAAAADDYAYLKTWNDVMGDIPACMKKCMNIFYKDSNVEKECGAPEKATDECLCKPESKKTISSIMTGVSDLDNCFKDVCTHSQYTNNSHKLDSLDNRLTGLQKHCLAICKPSLDPSPICV